MAQTRDPITSGLFTNGAGHVNADGPSGTVFTQTFTIDSAADLFTDPTAPIAAELITLTIPAGKKRCRVRWHTQAIPYVQSATSDIPWAAFVVATINAADDTTALTRLTVTNQGVGDHTADDIHRVISAQNPEIMWDTQKSAVDIIRLDVGAIPSTDTGAIPVYVTVEAW